MTLAPFLLALAVSVPGPGDLAPTPPAASVQATPADARERVSSWLGAIHRPVPADAYRTLGPAGVDALVEFARTDPHPTRRVRALEALAALGDARAEPALRESLARERETAVREGAARGLALLAGPAGAAAAVAPIVERDRDPAVRAAAAEALARVAPADGCARIRARAKVEPEPARFSRALATCDEAAPLPGR